MTAGSGKGTPTGQSDARWRGALRGVERAVRHKLPLLHMVTFQRYSAYRRFRTERLVMRGERASTSDHPSILFFTTHRCASVFLSDALRALCDDAGMAHVDFDSYFDLTRVARYRIFSEDSFLTTAFHTTGHYYGAYRSFRDIPQLDDYRVLLVLRDPRDVLTSLYFATLYSHRVTNVQILRRRQRARRMTLDEYVLDVRHDFLQTYQTYCEQLLGRVNVLYLRYEDMVSDFLAWLQRAAEHLRLAENVDLLGSIADEASFSTQREREHVFEHKRQVQPGDHTRKLQPETIKLLTSDFRPVLDRLGFV